MAQLNHEALTRAEEFARRIPPRLKGDALLASVVDQLAEGGAFRNMAWIEKYMRTRMLPMSREEFAQAMKKALK